jgi:hypothetical protein
MPSAPSDRNLLFGVLAVQMGFINSDALVAALNAWVSDKSRPLGEILVAQGAMQAAHRNVLEPLVDARLAMHGNSVEKSLATVQLPSPIRRQIHSVVGADVQATLSHLPMPPAPAESEHLLATTDYPNALSSASAPTEPVQRPATVSPTGEIRRSRNGRYQILRPHDIGRHRRGVRRLGSGTE